MDMYPPGSMTSTHSASPLPVAAAIANLKLLKKEKLAQRAARLGKILLPGLAKIQQRHPAVLGCLHGMGLVAGIQVVRAGTREPDSAMAQKINVACFQKGLLMFAPVGVGGECIKISPPLTISEDALRESLQILDEAVVEVLGPGA
jgi:4-aminobutyrate aminotransferase-like enzyme